jgi:hypothetical protein
VLLLAACGIGSPALAQRTAIAPLAPVVPKVAPPRSLDTDIYDQPPARPAVSVPDQPSQTVLPPPFYLINSRVLVGASLAKVNPQGIADVCVYRDANAPAKWRGLATNGLIAIALKPYVLLRIKTKSIAAIGRGLDLRGPVTYQLEGLPLEDLTLRIATADIAKFDTQQTASSTVVNIRLARTKSSTYPPGTILIRGVTSL